MESAFTFRIEGPEARAVAELLAQLVEEEFGVRPEIHVVAQPGTIGTRIDPVAVAALILSIPSAILATLDLVERARKKVKVERVLTTVREAPANTQVLLEAPHREVKDARVAHPADLLDPAAAELRAERVRTL